MLRILCRFRPARSWPWKQVLSFHRLANSNTMKYKCAAAGVESNTFAICFGHVGKKSTSLHCSSDPSGISQNGIWKSTMLSWSKIKTNQEMTGQWVSLQKWNQTLKVSSGVQPLKHRPPSYADQCTSLSSYSQQKTGYMLLTTARMLTSSELELRKYLKFTLCPCLFSHHLVSFIC